MSNSSEPKNDGALDQFLSAAMKLPPSVLRKQIQLFIHDKERVWEDEQLDCMEQLSEIIADEARRRRKTR